MKTTETRPVVGLTAAEAARRLVEQGPNRLPVQPGIPAWRRFTGELVHFFALLFWGAGALAFVAGLPQLGVAVFAVIVLNAIFAFVQEQRAEHAAEQLRLMLPRRATVIRDGRPIQIPAEELVVGDVVLLAEGDRISADARLDMVNSLAVDTSALTGESVPERPDLQATVFAGCFVVEGEARATIVASGRNTRLAQIAQLTQSQHPSETPLRRELSRVSRVIAIVAIAIGVMFFGLALLVGTPATDGFLFAVGVTVAVVPEGLLPTVTLSLAMGAQRMADRHALVRHLEAVETLGSTTFICTDKTGTLTQNEMSVVEVWMPSGSARISGTGYDPTAEITGEAANSEELKTLARTAVRCSSGRALLRDGQWMPHGDPMEAALDAFCHRLGIEVDEEIALDPDVARFVFDPHRRRMSVIVGRQVLVKGAPDSVLPLCDAAIEAGDELKALARRGLRVIAIAARELMADESLPLNAMDAEQHLTLLGLVALEDPPRHGTASALRACRTAGIRVAMLTGDHPETASAIGQEIGLIGAAGMVVCGSDLPEDPAALGELLDRDGVVVARVTPEDKLRIARALRERGHVVAMTGDGVNDAPALREAAIGVAMGKGGTDVAREAADLVLLDDNFETIVIAVEQGRSTFANIRRFLTYHLTDNVAELAPFVVWALSAGGFPLAIGVLQVLALDIGTDVFPALALGGEPPAKHVLNQPPIRGHLLDRKLFTRAFGVLGPVEALVALAAFVISFFAQGWRPGEGFPTGTPLLVASGATFTAIVLGQVANAFACRSTIRPVWRMGWRTNPLLIGAALAELAMLALFLYVPPIARILEHRGPTVAGFAAALVAVPAVIVADSLYKRFHKAGSVDL